MLQKTTTNHHKMQLKPASSFKMYLLSISISKLRSHKHTFKDKCLSLQSMLQGLVWGEKENNNIKDSFTNHFILRSIQTTEHEIMQILLSGQVGIDQTHLNGFAPVLVCVYTHARVHTQTHRQNQNDKVCLWLCFWVCEPICVCGHWSKQCPGLPLKRGANWSEMAVIGI